MCYFGKQIGKKRHQNRMLVMDIDKRNGSGKIRLILHADELYRILKYA